MVVLDTSAVIAVLRRERGYQAIERHLVRSDGALIGAPTLVETTMVAIGRLGVRGKTSVARFMQELNVDVIEFGAQHAARAVEAFQRFGKGRHPAGLNLGDCHSYATASIARESLLFVGNDFTQTDLKLVDLAQE